LLHNNKGLHKKYITKGIGFVSERDRGLIRKAHKAGVASLGVSYARSAEDIRSLRDCLPPGYRPRLYIKIETAMAIENLKDIMDQGECFIVDRGDLASEIGLSNIPAAQVKIVEKMLRNGKKIFLATQFLKNMIDQPVPLIAEVNDIATVFSKGVSGIQLSEETAIGKYPLNCVELITAMKKNYYKLSR
jgi:pyruvate kinase